MVDIANALTRALESAARKSDDDNRRKVTKDRLPIEEELQHLSDSANVYTVDAPCAFKPKDVVTPRDNSFYTNAGMPHVVLEVASPPHVDYECEGGCGNHNFGARLDMRIACMIPGRTTQWTVVPYWVESWQFEKWNIEKFEQQMAKPTP